MSKIRFRISTSPVDDMNPAGTFWVDVECDEADIQAIDEPPGHAGFSHGFDDFIEKFIKPAVMLAVDQYQEHFDDANDLQQKMLAAGGALPRSIDFYREKFKMDQARRQ